MDMEGNGVSKTYSTASKNIDNKDATYITFLEERQNLRNKILTKFQNQVC
jgi:hypothetical protein